MKDPRVTEFLKLQDISVADGAIDDLYSNNMVLFTDNSWEANQYLVLRSEINSQKTALCIHKGNGQVTRLNIPKNLNVSGVKPKDAKQIALLDSLNDSEILMSIAVGPAGTGKSTLALGYAFDQYSKENKSIYLSKSTALVGSSKAFGPVPGGVKEKYAPYLDSFKIILKNLLGDKSDSYLNMMQGKGQLQYLPIEYARGCTFSNCTFILDESQNLTWHELKTICSRMGDKAKLILLGDLEQIDTKSARDDNGFNRLLSSKAFRNSSITSGIYLTEQYRGPIPQLISEIDNEDK